MTSVARTIRPGAEPRVRSTRPERPAMRVVPTRPEPRRNTRAEHAVAVPRARIGMAVAGMVIVVFAALMASAVVRAMLVTGQEQIDQTNATLRESEQLLQKEKVQLASYQSPARIAAKAQSLGMVATDDQRWVSLGDGGTAFDTTDSTPGTTDTETDDTNSSELAAAAQ